MRARPCSVLRLVIIGNGMASLRLVERLLKKAPGRYAITVIGSEAGPAYNRVLLSSLLAGEADREAIALRSRDWYTQNGVTLLTGERVTEIDTSARLAICASGRRFAYHRLVIAAGSEAVRLPLPGANLSGVTSFRDVNDVVRMQSMVKAGTQVAVIGGGLLGIEAASGLARLGAKVTLVHAMDRLMERQLDHRGARFLQQALQKRGIRVILQAQSVAILGQTKTTGLRLADGSDLAADMVVMAVGIRPRVELAAGAGLKLGRGILVDDHLATNIANVFAIGECAEHRGVVHGLVEPAFAQADALASRLSGENVGFGGLTPATNLKVSGVPVFSAGDVLGDTHSQAVVMECRARGHYRKLVFKGHQLVGCVLIGECEDGLWYNELIRSECDVSAMRADLVHGRAFADPMHLQAA